MTMRQNNSHVTQLVNKRNDKNLIEKYKSFE